MRTRVALFASLCLILGGGAAAWHLWHVDQMTMARRLLHRGDFRGAELVLRGVVQSQPGNAVALEDLGLAELRSGDPVAAEHALREAAAHGADEHALRPLLARALVEQGRDAEVLDTDRADGLAPADAAALHIARAIAALHLQQPDTARREAEAARTQAAGSTQIMLDAAKVVRATGDAATARRLVEQALVLDPSLPDALLERASLIQAAGDAAGAIAAYGDVLGDRRAALPERLEAHLRRAELLVRRGAFEAARPDVDAVLSRVPRSRAANLLAATIDAATGRWQPADAAAEQAGSLDLSPHAALLFAVVKAHVGAPARAFAAAERFHARAPHDLAGTVVLAALDLHFAQPAAAQALLRPAADAGIAATASLELLAAADRAAGAQRPAGDRAQADPNPDPILAEAQAQGGGALDDGHVLDLAKDAALGALDVAVPGAPDPAPDPDALPPALPPALQADRNRLAVALAIHHLDAADRALAALEADHAPAALVDLSAGLIRLGRSDLPGARQLFSAALAARPDDPEATAALARTMRIEGRDRAALDLLRPALAHRPGMTLLVETVAALATGAKDPGIRADALAALQSAHRQVPGDANLTGMLARADLVAGRADEALALAHTLDAAHWQVLGLRADAERALGHADRAVAAYAAMVAATPDNVALLDQIVGILVEMRRLPEAQTLVDEGLARVPDSVVLQVDAVRLAGAIDGTDAALARADAFAHGHPGNPGAILLAGNYLASTGRFDLAAARFAKDRDGLPAGTAWLPRAELVAAQAVAEFHAGQAAQAQALLRDALGTHPDDPGLAKTLAAMDMQGGDLAEARRLLAHVRDVTPDDGVALNDLAWLEQQAGDQDAALRDAREAYRLHPAPQVADTLGWILVSSNHADQSLPLLRAAAAQLADAQTSYHLAVALAKTGDQADARRTLGAVLASSSTFAQRKDAEQLAARLASGP